MVERVTRRGLNFLLILFVVFSALLLATVLPFFAYVFFGAFAAFLVWPGHRFLRARIGNYPSAWIMVTGVYAVIFVPIILLALSIFRDLLNAWRRLGEQDQSAESYIRGFLVEILPEEQAELAAEWLANALGELVLRIAGQAIGGAPQMLLGVFIFGFILFYALLQGERMAEFIRELVPLRGYRVDALFAQIRLSLNAVFYGVIFVAIIQATAGGIVWWLAGLPNPFFYGGVMFALSIIPFAGPSFILIPAGIQRIYQGEPGWGIFLIASGVVFVGSIDNFLRPIMVSRFGKINPAMVVVGLAGGIVAFGVVGVVIGPLIFALWVAVARELHWEIQHWKAKNFETLSAKDEAAERKEHEARVSAEATAPKESEKGLHRGPDDVDAERDGGDKEGKG